MPGHHAEKRRVLIVEDTSSLAQALRGRLESEGYTVEWAGDGYRALESARRLQPDLVVLDWMLPGLDGLDLLRRLRLEDPALPILMLTARSRDDDKVTGIGAGADDYLTKPFSLPELVARVAALLRRSNLLQDQLRADRLPSQERLRSGALELDPARHEARLEGRRLDLTRLEFGVLGLLLRHPGRTFSRDYLLDTVWGSETFVSDRAVDNTVMRLRRKLGPAGSVIEAVWGMGYRLVETASISYADRRMPA